jgi:hypothetical protein
MSTGMPTEMQCLAHQMCEQAAQNARSICKLPNTFAALTNWEVGHHGAAVANIDASEMLLAARMLEFNATRLNVLATQQADDARYLFSLSIQMVDLVRFIQADGSSLQKAKDFAARCEESLAKLQERIAEQFPGETCVGD